MEPGQNRVLGENRLSAEQQYCTASFTLQCKNYTFTQILPHSDTDGTGGKTERGRNEARGLTSILDF